jgi:hypothetical protein
MLVTGDGVNVGALGFNENSDAFGFNLKPLEMRLPALLVSEDLLSDDNSGSSIVAVEPFSSTSDTSALTGPPEGSTSHAVSVTGFAAVRTRWSLLNFLNSVVILERSTTTERSPCSAL